MNVFKTTLDSACTKDKIKPIINTRNSSTLEEIFQGIKEKFAMIISKSILS